MNRYGVAIAASAVVALALSGCSSEGSGSLTFVSWGGVYQEAESESFVTPFAEEQGITVKEDSPTDYAKLKTMVESGNVSWDVVDGDPFFVNPNCGTLVEKIDTSIVDTANFPEGMVSECGVPIIQFSQVIMYNTDTYSGDKVPKSWEDFFDLEKFPGKRAIGNSATYGALEGALLADGVAPEDLYPIDYERAFAKLDTIKDSLQFWDSGSQQEQLLQSGEVDFIVAWSGRGADAVRNGATFEPVWDGGILVYNVLFVPKGSKHVDEAMELINFATSPEAQATLAENIAYSPANLKATPQLDEVGQKFLVTDPKIQAVSVQQDMNWWGGHLDEGTSKWTEWALG